MPRESIIFGIAGIFFGILVGWMLGSQQARQRNRGTELRAPQPGANQTAGPFDESRTAELKAAIDKNKSDVTSAFSSAICISTPRFAEATRVISRP